MFSELLNKGIEKRLCSDTKSLKEQLQELKDHNIVKSRADNPDLLYVRYKGYLLENLASYVPPKN